MSTDIKPCIQLANELRSQLENWKLMLSKVKYIVLFYVHLCGQLLSKIV